MRYWDGNAWTDQVMPRESRVGNLIMNIVVGALLGSFLLYIAASVAWALAGHDEPTWLQPTTAFVGAGLGIAFMLRRESRR